jgi:sec-independent protein translocase protein TatB
MLDIAWPELVVIGAVALVAIGPKDLPKVMRTCGQWVGKARHMMQDIQRNFEQLNYETEVAEKLQKQAQTKAEDAVPVMMPLCMDNDKPPHILPPSALPPNDPTPVLPADYDRPKSSSGV